LSLRLKTLTESQARMSYGRSFQFIAAASSRLTAGVERMSADYEWDYE